MLIPFSISNFLAKSSLPNIVGFPGGSVMNLPAIQETQAQSSHKSHLSKYDCLSSEFYT